MAVTWDPAHKNAGITLSGGNLIATGSAGSGTVNQAALATQAISPSLKNYFEVTATGTMGQYFSFGVMNGSASLSGNIGASNGAAFLNKGGGSTSSLFVNGTQFGSYPALVAGQVLRVAVDHASNRMWWAINNNTWSGAAVWMGSGGTTDDPATGTGGLGISGVTGTIYPAFSSAWTGDVATINGGVAGFAYTMPSGFTRLDGGTLTNVNSIWSDTDCAAGISLTANRLTAKCIPNSVNSVRAITNRSSGKYYWEYTCNTFTNGADGVGVELGSYSLTSNVASGTGSVTGACGVSFFGQLCVDGASSITVGGVGGSTVSFGTITSGTVICVAIDLSAKLVWFRLGAAGNWNNSAGRDPATGTGGAAIPNLGGGAQTYPAVTVSAANDQVTANFGDSAFVGAVPSGFAAGFPGPAPVTARQYAVTVNSS